MNPQERLKASKMLQFLKKEEKLLLKTIETMQKQKSRLEVEALALDAYFRQELSGETSKETETSSSPSSAEARGNCETGSVKRRKLLPIRLKPTTERQKSLQEDGVEQDIDNSSDCESLESTAMTDSSVQELAVCSRNDTYLEPLMLNSNLPGDDDPPEFD